LDCVLSEITVVEPDLLFIESSRLSIFGRRGVEGPPTLAVEVISPHSRTIDRKTKLQLYARYGIANYWIVDPEARTVEAYVLAGDAYRLEKRGTEPETVSLPPFASLAIDLAMLWS